MPGDQRVGPDFWLSEFLFSQTATRLGIDNTPQGMALANIINILGPGMQRVRDLLGTPVFISSGFRCPELNRKIGGSEISQHMVGLAADFTSPQFGLPSTIAHYLMEREPVLRYDQLILEGRWVHISFNGVRPRGEVLTAHFTPKGVTYTKGLA